MRRAQAHAKINLALVVGPRRVDGKHEVVTVLQKVELHDEIALRPSAGLVVEGFPDDTIVRHALEALADAAGVEPRWSVRIDKRIPVAAGLGGGSSDAAAALQLANGTLPERLPDADLHRLAAGVGADVPFFLQTGSQLAVGDGTKLARIELPLDYCVLLVLPHDVAKQSTAAVYQEFEARDGSAGFESRTAELRRSLDAISTPRDLAELPHNDLASSPVTAELVAAGAFRADVTGAGPTLYGLFEDLPTAERVRRAVDERAWTTLTRPVAG